MTEIIYYSLGLTIIASLASSTFEPLRLPCIALFVATLAYSLYIYPTFLSPLLHLPDAPVNNNLIFGHYPESLKQPIGRMHRDWLNNVPNKGLIRAKGLMGALEIYPTSLTTAKSIFSTHCYDWEKPVRRIGDLLDLVGMGVFAAEGDVHKVRTLLEPKSAPHDSHGFHRVFMLTEVYHLLAPKKEFESCISATTCKKPSSNFLEKGPRAL